MAQRLFPALRKRGAGGEKAKLYPEQARAGTLTLLAEFQVGRKEPPGDRSAKRDDCPRQNAAYRPTRTSHPVYRPPTWWAIHFLPAAIV